METKKYMHSTEYHFTGRSETSFLTVIIYTEDGGGGYTIHGCVAIPLISKMYNLFTGIGLCMN